MVICWACDEQVHEFNSNFILCVLSTELDPGNGWLSIKTGREG